MALFKIEKGKSTDLFTKRPSSVEGHCYFTPDDGKFYIDVTNADQATSTTRIPLNAKYADLSYAAYRDQHGNIIDEFYAKKNEGAFFIEGSGTTDSSSKTSSWTGSSDRITRYYDGLTIRYKIGVAGQSTVTLNINGLGAKTVYRFSTTKLTTHFPVGSIIQLIYHEDLNGGCWVTNDYDANTNTYQRLYKSSNNVEYPITTRYATTDGASYYAEYGRYTNGVTLNPSTNTITATAFKGELIGNADTATKATSADKLNTDAGSATQPIYFANGIPVATTYQLNKTVPANAKFTDTTYSNATSTAPGLMSAADKTKLDAIAEGATANVGTITGVTAGAGLTGGGTSGKVTLNIGQGEGITVTDNAIALSTVGTAGTYGPSENVTGTEGTTVSIPQIVVDAYGRVTSVTERIYTSKNTNTTYTAGTGLSLSGTTINHKNSVTAKTTNNQTTASPGYGGTFKVTEPLYDAQGHITSVNVATITMPAAQTIPTALKNPKALTIGTKTYDGSSAITVTAADLGLSNALHFIGAKTSLPSSGTDGDVVLIGSKEYVYSSGDWIELGDGDSHALKTVTISAGSGLTGGGSLASNRTISHADTSSQDSISASGRRYITGVTLDGFGHVTGLTTGTETVTDTGATSVEVTGSGNAITAASYNATTRKITFTKGATYNNYSLPTASNTTLGGVKTTSTVTSTSGLTAVPIINGVPYYKDTTYSLSSFGITATAAEINKLDGVTATTAELNYVDGVTSNIQTQLNDKVSKTDTGVQSIAGGLVLGGTSATATGKGRLMITGNTNPLIGLQALDGNGNQLTPYYIQVYNDILYLGPTSAKALSSDRDGNVSIPATLSVTGAISEGGTSLSTKYAANKNMTGATSSAAGAAGLVPAPAAGKQGQFLRGDGTWATPTNTTYTAGTGISISGTKINHSNSITAGSVGSAQSPAHGGTFAIPKITYDAQGHITGATTVNITLPADSNTDTKVTQTAKSDNVNYPILGAASASPTSGAAAGAVYDTGMSINPSTNTIKASIFSLEGLVNFVYNATDKCVDIVFA